MGFGAVEVTRRRGDTVMRRSSDGRQENWRVFCAIELSQDVRSRIQQHIDRLRAAVPEFQGSWSRIDNMHLSVKFFGNVAQNRIARISSAASQAVAEFQPFHISIAASGAFPESSHPRVLWIGVVDPTGNLGKLQQHFEIECSAEGFEEEDRAFRPHLTIVRIRKPEGARATAEVNQKLGFGPVTLPVTELVVFRSELSSKGSQYTALSRHKF